MRPLYSFWLLSAILRNPILALIVLAFIYAVIDQQFIGVLPDFTKPFRRNSRIRSLRAEIERSPFNAAASQELGLLLVEQGSYEEAAKRLQSALERMPENANVRLGLGIALYNLGEYEQAVAEIQEAIKLNPKAGYGLPNVYLLMNELRLGESGDSAVIADLIEKILSYGSPEVLYRSGVALQQAGDKDGAKRMFSAAVSNYRSFPGRVRKLHRRWAYAAWLRNASIR